MKRNGNEKMEAVLLTRPTTKVAVLTLNRPDARNALGPELVALLPAKLDELEKEGRTRAVVITGTGSAFCAGADLATLKSLQSATAEENDRDCEALRNLYKRMVTSPLPLVAAVNGPALAGGCGLASLCDIVIASQSAVFGYPEVRIGFVAAMVLVFLSRQVGERLARELLLTGRTLKAEEAREAGFVSRVVPDGDLLDEAVKTASQVASNAPSAVALTKELLWHTSGLPVGDALGLASRLNVYARSNPEMREGLSAFFEKRKPQW